MVYLSRRSLLCLACLGLSVVGTAKADESASSPSNSPAAHTDLICPNDNAADCYPRNFQPTKDFQIIKEGQDIPPGLHVRMNIWSGEKEARLNIPMEGEENPELEGLPVEQAMVVVDVPQEEAPQEPQKEDKIPKKAPVYEAAGSIPPPPPGGSNDVTKFQTSMLTIQMEGRGFDSALSDIAELSHDIYYGVEVAKDGPVVEKLICLTLGSGSENFPAKENERDHKAASILAAAVQNNPTALKTVADLGRLVMYPNCDTALIEPPTRESNNFVSILRNRLGREKEPGTLKSKVTAISGLLKDASIRKEFLELNGMELLLAIWLKSGDKWDNVRMKVAQLIMDNFLDESMGAALGTWPQTAVAESKVCQTKGSMLDDGCWEHHIEALMSASPKKPWAVELLAALKKQRTQGAGSTVDREL